MGVAAQVEAEMAKVLRRIFGLRLAAQHDLVDQPLDLAAFDLGEDAVEAVGLEHAALGQRNVDGRQKFAQRVELFLGRLVVHAIDQRHARALAAFGGGDIGQNHELFDQPVRFQPRRHDHAIDGTVAP